jgi:hypothetical protein
MSDQLVVDAGESSASADSWQSLCSVLDGVTRPQLTPKVVQLVGQIAEQPCDVCISPGRFEVWYATRPLHVQHPFALAAPALHYRMRLLSLSRATEHRWE